MSSINITKVDGRKLYMLGGSIALSDPRAAWQEAAILIAVTNGDAEFNVALSYFLAGVRNFADGVYHFEAIERKMRGEVQLLKLNY